MTRKLPRPLSEETAAAEVRELASTPVVATDAALITQAVESSRRNQLSLWDALILRAAVAGGCETLHSEDLAHGAVLDGVELLNPFVDSGKPPMGPHAPPA